MELGIVRPVGIVEEMTGAYLDYSMSVIVSRALPDVRDGLKPVHRRVLYAMDQMGLQSNRSFRKCAGIVGEVLKEYHPHGDAAVYDTLVRLTQWWNMRYPLALGQGNFGCFTGDTQLSMLDGTEKTFAELAELPADEAFYVYSVNDNGRIVVGEGRHARVTRKDAQLVEVTLDNGDKLRCTPDHRFMLRAGTYKQAQDLTPDDSLMPGYFDTASVREGMNRYLRIMQPVSGEFEFVHHIADRFNLESGADVAFKGPFVRHHKNFNRFDNRPTNIERMDFLAHLHLHAELVEELWADPTFREAQRAGVVRYYDQNPHVRQARRDKFVQQNRQLAFRQANGQRVASSLRIHYASHPEVRRQISERMKELWQDADYRDRMYNALRGIEKRPLTPEQRQEVSRIVSEKSKAMWGDDGKRAEIVTAIILSMSSPSVRAKLSARSRAKWSDPAYRAKFGSNHFSRMAQASWNRPGMREFHRAKIAQQWSSDEFRTAQSEGVRESNHRRLEANPEMMQELAQKAAVALRENWASADYKRQVMRQRISRYVSRLLQEVLASELTPGVYDSHRDAKWIPTSRKATAYFDSWDEGAGCRCALQPSRRIRAIPRRARGCIRHYGG